MQDQAQSQNTTTSAQSSASSAPGSDMPVNDNFSNPASVPGSIEHEPVSIKSPDLNQPDIELQPEASVSKSAEVNIPNELKNIVEHSPVVNNPKISPDLKNAGVSVSNDSVLVITTPTGRIKLPMTYIQAKQKNKETRFDDSMHWLSAMVMYQWSKHDHDVAK